MLNSRRTYLIYLTNNILEQKTETAEIPLVVDTFQWPVLKVDDISEIHQKPLSKHISKQVVVRRNTGRSKRGRQEYFCEICKIFVQDSYRYRHHYGIRFLRRYHLNYQ